MHQTEIRVFEEQSPCVTSQVRCFWNHSLRVIKKYILVLVVNAFLAKANIFHLVSLLFQLRVQVESICCLEKFRLACMPRFSKLRFILPWIHQFIKVYLLMLALLLKCYRTKWYMKWIVYWTWNMKSSEAMNLKVKNERHFNKNSQLQRGLHLWPCNAGAGNNWSRPLHTYSFSRAKIWKNIVSLPSHTFSFCGL